MTSAVPSFFFPPALKDKGTVGIVAPGCWPDPVWIDKTREMLHEAEYHVEVHAQNYLKNGTLAGSDAARVEALTDMFADQTIDAILCARGGTGALNLLDKLNYKLIKRCPKPLVGFSDMTCLLHAITKHCGFVTYHGPMCYGLAKDPDPRTFRDLLNVVGEQKERQTNLNFDGVEVVRSGKAEGILSGGNLTLLQHLIGTPHDFSTKDAILFIEDRGEKLYKLVYKLRHLQLAGKLKNLRAVLVGEMVDISDDAEAPFGPSLREALMEILPPEIPLCFDFPCGHGSYTTTLPVGAFAHVAMDARGVSLSYMRDEG